MPEKPTAAVVTVSDSCARGERIDQSGPAVVEVLTNHGFKVIARETVPDDQAVIEKTLRSLASSVRLVVTTGGTGISPRDNTPEATRVVCDRLLDGIGERMRAEGTKKTLFAVLSRALCGVHGSSVLLNLPGSPKGAVESLAAVIEILPHALQLLDGDTSHGSQ